MGRIEREAARENVVRILQLGERASRTLVPGTSIAGDEVQHELFAQWRAGSVTCLVRVFGMGHPYALEFQKEVKNHFPKYVDHGMGVLRAALADIDAGALTRIHDIAVAEVFTDFLDMAEHLHDAGLLLPAAAVAGAVLEDGLRKACEKHGLKFKRSDGISALTAKLVSGGQLTGLDSKKIAVWAKIRNDADHGHADQLKSDDVGEMVQKIGVFVGDLV